MAIDYDSGDLNALLLDATVWSFDATEFDEVAYAGFNLSMLLQSFKTLISDKAKIPLVKYVILVSTLRGPRACYKGSVSNLRLPATAQTKIAAALATLGLKNDKDITTGKLGPGELTPSRLCSCAPHLVAAAIMLSYGSGKPKTPLGDPAVVATARAQLPLYLIHPGMGALMESKAEIDAYVAWTNATKDAVKVASSGRSSTANPGALAQLAYDQKDLMGPGYCAKVRGILRTHQAKFPGIKF
jgi:hypothetical protein